MKKYVALLCAAVLLMGTLAACGQGSGGGSASSAGGETGGTVKINMMAYAMSVEEVVSGWNQVIENYNSTHEGVEVSIDFAGEWDEMSQKLSKARLAGDQVDIILSQGGIIRSQLAPTGALMDLTEVIKPFEDRFVPGTLGNYVVGGHLWGFPRNSTTTSCVFYNKTMFDELGLSEPTTFDELVECANTIRAEKNIKNPWIHQGAIVDYWQMWFEETYGQETNHESVARIEDWLSGNSSFVNDETIAAFADIKSLFDAGVLTTDSLDTDDTSMRAAFVQKEAAMFYGGTWEYTPTLTAVNGDFEIGVFQMPSFGSGKSALSCGGADDGFAIPSNCNLEHWDVLIDFLDYATSPEALALTAAPTNPVIPAFNCLEPADVPCAAELSEFMNSTEMFLDWMWPAEINNALGNQIAAVAAGAASPEEAAQAVQDVYEKLVSEEGYAYNWYDSWTEEEWAAVTPPQK